MTKIAIVGSCLSGLIADAMQELDPACSVVSVLPHIRSDAFCDYLIDRCATPIPDAIAGALIAQDGHPQWERRNRIAQQHQSTAALVHFRGVLQEVDLFLIDNNYDLSIGVYDGLHPDYLSSKFHFVAKAGTPGSLGLISIDESLRCFQRVVSWLSLQNPGAKIVFAQYPANPFAEAGLTSRANRSYETAAAMNLRGVTVVPPVFVPASEQKVEKGPNYFNESAYRVYAQLVLTILKGRTIALDGRREIHLSDLQALLPGAHRPSRGPNPYTNLPERKLWRSAVAQVDPLEMTGLYRKRFPISTDDRIATCGSCFAQHIGRHLRANGFAFIDFEAAPSELPGPEHARHGYSNFSARYGNVYSPRQLLQLFRRAFGTFVPVDQAWEQDGRWFDPYRPAIEPGGFDSKESLLRSRERHLSAVRQMFTDLDLFVFTFGLTESWAHKRDGAVYPVCPGVAAGAFDPHEHTFVNFDYGSIHADFDAFLTALRQVNPSARVLLTVSPVPLTATASENHVLVATMYSKSVLRAAAGALRDRYDFVDYFPAYEIVSSFPFRGMFYEPDLRGVSDAGVRHVMTHFFAEHRANRRETMDEPDAGGEYCEEVLLDIDRGIKTA